MEADKIDCQKYEECSAPICPLDNSVKCGVWYADEDICQLRRFQRLPWVIKQKLVAKAGASNEKYFTMEMLLAKRQIRKGIEGIDPDQPLEMAKRAEKKWMGIKVKRVVAKKIKKSKRVVAEKRGKLKKTGKKRGRPKKLDGAFPYPIVVKNKRGRPKKN
jgi:hypothetical protein